MRNAIFYTESYSKKQEGENGARDERGEAVGNEEIKRSFSNDTQWSKFLLQSMNITFTRSQLKSLLGKFGNPDDSFH